MGKRKKDPKVALVAVAIIHNGSCSECKAEAAKTKATTDEYRAGWDRIFGTKQTVGQA